MDDLLADLRERGLMRTLRAVEPSSGMTVVGGGRRLANFGSNDYLGLGRHPALAEAASAAAERFGTGAGASRLVTGNHSLYGRLEEATARFVGAEAALVFPTGYQAGLGALMALASDDVVWVLDRLAHASLVDGARLAGGRLKVFPHNDVAKLRRVLARERRIGRPVVVAESVYSMDGDLAPVAELARTAREFGATLVLDEAHAVGVFGPDGAGLAAAAGLVPGDDLIVMGTYSKALGGLGGFLAGSETFARVALNRARSLIYTTGLPPGVVAASTAALEIATGADAERARLFELVRHLREGLFRAGLEVASEGSQIVPAIVGRAETATRMSAELERRGFLAPAIRPPTVAAGRSRLRLSVTALHTPVEIEALGAEIARLVRAESSLAK
jgi:8-amino-7-oxononanoate synthase